jgi:hypothetical protein
MSDKQQKGKARKARTMKSLLRAAGATARAASTWPGVGTGGLNQLSGDMIYSGGLVSNCKLPGAAGELTMSVYLAVSGSGAGLGKMSDPIHPLINSRLAVLQSVRRRNRLRFEGEVVHSNEAARVGRRFVITAHIRKNFTNLDLILDGEKFTGRGFVFFGDGADR